MSIDFRVGLGGSGTASLGQVVYRGDIPGFTSRADGSVGHSGVTIHDPTGTIEIVGLNKFEVNEDACDNPRIYTGITTERDIERAVGHRVTTQRVWETNVADQNAYLHLRVIGDHNHGNRPAETDVARVAWLLDEVLHAGHVIDAGNGPTAGVQGAPRNLDAADYRGQHADDVLADIGPPGNRRFFCYWDADEEAVALFYGLNSESLGDSPIRISNVITDQDADTFYPSMDAALTRDPQDVAGAIYYKYRNGVIYREDPDTLADFLDRGISIVNERVGLASTASTFVDRLLDRASRERDEITVTIQVPKERVNHVREGQRVEVKFTHLPGYEAFVFVHVKARTVIQDIANPDWYEIRLELCDYIGGLGSGGGGGGAPSTPYQPQPGPAGVGALYAAGDNGVTYYVNGTLVGDNSSPSHSFPHEVPTGILVTGDNVLAMYVENGVEPPSWAGGNETYIEARLYLGTDDSGTELVVSTTAAKTWDIENVAGTLGGLPANWNEASFNDAGWDNAVDVTGTSVNLIAAAPISPARLIAPPDAPSGDLGNVYARGLKWLVRMNFTISGGTSTPNNGQEVRESIPGDASGDTLTTNFPYHPGSLETYVGGQLVVPDETDPEAGEFTLPVDTTGQTVVVIYQATGNPSTGASNPQPAPGDGGAGGSGASELDDLTDVTITSPSVGDFLRFDGTEWVNVPALAYVQPLFADGVSPLQPLENDDGTGWLYLDT